MKKIEMVLVDDVKPYEKNAKKHPKGQVDKIAKSIKAFGFNQPLVLNKDMVLIVGHGRLEAAKKLGMEKVPALILDIEEKGAKAYRLADNKLNESPWDMQLVIEELRILAAEDFDISLTGFDEDLSLSLSPESGEMPSVPSEPTAKLGDIYQLGDHRLMCGDSALASDVEKLMGGGLADMVFTDPPYNIDYDFSKNGMVEAGHRKAKFGKIKNDKMKAGDFDKFISDVFANLDAFMREGASFYISAGRESTVTFNRILEEKGFYIAQWLIWVKENFNISRLSYHPRHEIVTFGWKKGGSHFWKGGRSQSDILDFGRDQGAVHPTQKPVAMLEKFMTNSSEKGAVVLDLFGGSGATVIAAEKCARSARLMELDPRYVDVIVQRWENLTGKKALKLTN